MPKKVYLDMCCLKRPYDDQTQPRIAMETGAVLAVLSAVRKGSLIAIRSLAHDQENARNINQRRAAAVQTWLDRLNPSEPLSAGVAERAIDLEKLGLGAMDAYHLAWAESLGADVFLTTDDDLLGRARRLRDIIKLRVLNPAQFADEGHT